MIDLLERTGSATLTYRLDFTKDPLHPNFVTCRFAGQNKHLWETRCKEQYRRAFQPYAEKLENADANRKALERELDQQTATITTLKRDLIAHHPRNGMLVQHLRKLKRAAAAKRRLETLLVETDRTRQEYRLHINPFAEWQFYIRFLIAHGFHLTQKSNETDSGACETWTRATTLL